MTSKGKEDELILNVIDCINYVYIKKQERYGAYLTQYKFDGVEPVETNKDYWYRLDKIPKKITRLRPKERINQRYELKQGFVATELMPQTLEYHYDADMYEDIINLYNLRYDEVDGGIEDVKFSINEIYKRENYEFISNTYDASVDLLTQIEFPIEAHQDKPCKLDSQQVFNLIVKHVKANIDTRVAQITSDYKFHFEVERIIDLDKSFEQRYDSSGYKARKPKWTTRLISTKKVSILNIKNELRAQDYGSNCVVPNPIIGENYEDLNNKVTNFLDKLIQEINVKYCECPNCKGWGVIIK